MLPMKAGVGGYYNFALVSTDTDGVTNDRGHGFQQNIEMEFQGETMLDNGLTAGVRIRISGNNGGPHAHDSDDDEDGRSGRPRRPRPWRRRHQYEQQHRRDRGVLQGRLRRAPHGHGGKRGVSDPELGAGRRAGRQRQVVLVRRRRRLGGDVGYMDEDAPKIVYFSPNFNGISLAASYAPEDSEASYAGSSDDDGDVSQQIALSLSYSVDIMGGSVSANVSRESYTTESKDGVDCSAGCGPTAMRYGATISFDDFSLGANVLDSEDPSGGGNDFTGTVVGIGWSQGPLSLGAQHGSTEAGAKEATITAFNAGYNLGPGINVGARIATGENDGADYTQFVLATFFNF